MDGEITIGTKLDTKKFDAQILVVERRIKEIEEDLSSNKELGFLSEREVANLNAELEKSKNKLINLREQKEKLANSNDIKQLANGFKDLGSPIQNAVKKVSRLALGVYGIRSAYMALRRASSDLASYDEQYATNLEYIKYALTQAIAPVLQWIVNLSAQLLGYINAIMQGWFGINLFSRGSVENFKKMKAGASGVSKAVAEIKKQLTGFDEMNILQDNGNVGTGGGGGGIGTIPTFDLSATRAEPPKWLEWIISHKNDILTILASISAGLLAWKLGLSALMSLGIAVAIYGIIESVKGLLAFIKNPTWKNFKKFLGGLAIAITGVATAMIAFNATNPVGWILLAVSAVIALTTAIIDLIARLTTNRAKILDTKKAQDELTKAQQKAKETTDAYVSAVENAEQSQNDLIQAERKNKLSGEELYNAVKNGTLDYKNMNTAQREVYKAYLANKTAQENLKTATEEMSNAKKEETKASWENQLAVANETKKYNEFKNSIIEAYNQGELSAEEARYYIERAMQNMSDTTRRIFTQDLPNTIAEGLNPSRYENIWDKFRRKWNEFWDNLKTNLSMSVSANFSAGGGYGGGKGSRRRTRKRWNFLS